MFIDLVLVLFALTVHAETPAAPPDTLKRAFENEITQSSIRSQYFYREHAERRAARSDGAPGKLTFTRQYEWVYLEGEPFRKLVTINGAPLSRKIANEEKRRMQMTAAERRAAASNRKPVPHIIRLGDVPPSDILRVMDHRLLREEPVDGRNTWVIQAEPRKDLVPSTGEEARTLCYRYTFWIDQEDFVVAQQAYEVIRVGVEGLPGSRARATFHRASSGVWFPSTLEGYFESAPPKQFSKWYQSHRFYDFRKFDSSSTITFEQTSP
jgi:hypothetical protein